MANLQIFMNLFNKGCTVSLHYNGTLVDGTVFDSSVERNEPFEFELGKGRVIKGFEMFIPTMRKGEKSVLTCAPEYGYGPAGSPPKIPANSTLRFEVRKATIELSLMIVVVSIARLGRLGVLQKCDLKC